MSGKFMKIKRIVIPTITLIIMTSQLLGCSSVTSKEMLDMIDRQEAIVIEVPEPISQEQGEETEYNWMALSQLITYPEFRASFDDIFNIVPYGNGGKAGSIYIDSEGNQNNNSTLYDAMMNQKFAKAWDDTDNIKEVISSVKETYADVDTDSMALVAALNAYFNLTPDNEPNYFNGNSTLTRGEYLGLVYRASNPVQSLEDVNDLESVISDSKGVAVYNENGDEEASVSEALFASQLADSSYLTTSDSSLNTDTFNGTITRAEAIYTLVKEYYSDEFDSVTGKESCYSDAKNGGDIASKAGFVVKDKKTGEVTEKTYWKSYELSYALQNESKGLPTDLYKALVVAKNHNLITGDESHWSDGLTKGEAINFILRVYEDLANTNGYINNVERGASTGEVVTDATVVEDYDYSKLFPGFSSDNIVDNADGTKTYSEAFYNQCRTYVVFEGATDEEIAKVVAIYMPEESDYAPEEYHKQFSILDDAGIKASDILTTSEGSKGSGKSDTKTDATKTNSTSNTGSSSNQTSNTSQTNDNTQSTPSDNTYGYGNTSDDTSNYTPSEPPVTSADVEAALNNLGLYDNSAIGANGKPSNLGPDLGESGNIY